MKASFLALIVLAALAAACHERRQDPRPDYDSIRAHSESAHGALDSEGKQQP
jgi:hypothetical protein